MHSRVVLALLVSCAALMFLACGGAGNGGANKPGADPVDREVEASVQAEKFVLQFVKYPRDASFSWSSRAGHLGHDTWVATGTFNAKNAFGAELTHAYECYVWLENNAWHCRSVIIDDEVLYQNTTLSLHERMKSGAEKPQPVPQAHPIAASPLRTEWRTWTSGRFTVEARFSGYQASDKIVLLTKRNGDTSRIPLEKLSNEDQELVRAEIGEH